MPWRRSPLATTLRALSSAVDFKAGYVPGHSENVAYLIQMMAREAGYDADVTSRLGMAAYVHDVGKIRLPDAILLAQRKLTAEEYELVKLHPVHSAEVCHGFGELADVIPWVLHHHEHFDGSGYPDGLVGEAIPWPSRMLLAADAFQVMTADRPYAPARTRAEALTVMQANAGSQFCPVAVELLIGRVLWRPADPPLSGPPIPVAGLPTPLIPPFPPEPST